MADKKSPAKMIRSLRRCITFIKMKMVSLLPISPNLSKTIFPTISFSPEKPKLSLETIEGIDIRPRKIYHPCIINACFTMFKKHPDLLAQEEIVKFNEYRAWKKERDDPLESNPIYLPIGGLRKCLVCENLT